MDPQLTVEDGGDAALEHFDSERSVATPRARHESNASDVACADARRGISNLSVCKFWVGRCPPLIDNKFR